MSLYNNDDLVAPSWINQEFLQKVLIQYENQEFIEIIKFVMSPACMKGDHYASIMFRCKVTYRMDKSDGILEKSLIIKTIPEEKGEKRDMLMESNVFENEIEMYTKTLPKIEKILADYGEPTKLSAEIIYHALEPHKIIILEDLCELGYVTVRGRYLNENEVKAVYSKIAKLHAVSYMLGKSRDHEIVTQYTKPAFSFDSQMVNDLITNGINNFIDLLKSHQEFQPYLSKVEILKPQLKDECQKLFNAFNLDNQKQRDIFVLNHGDFHIKNLMFRFNKKTHLEDLIMVDYQVSCFAPSNIDMIYSQYMILAPHLRLRRMEFMYYYFMEFKKTLENINYQGEMPLFSDFKISSIKYRHYNLFVMSAIFPMVEGFLTKPIDDLTDIDADSLPLMYNHPKYIEDIRNLLPIMLQEGYLD